MTIVYYVMDGDDLLVSTMAGRAKTAAVERNPQVSAVRPGRELAGDVRAGLRHGGGGPR